MSQSVLNAAQAKHWSRSGLFGRLQKCAPHEKLTKESSGGGSQLNILNVNITASLSVAAKQGGAGG